VEATALHSLLTLALLGYGEVQDGRPTWEQREMHTYTNLVRVDPTAWASDYACSTASFTTSERTAKAPLLYHDGLTEIAQLHSEDMAAHGFMDHDSSDGTTFAQRVWPYYAGSTIAENVAWGYADNAAAVWRGWMCSAGHRENIMSPSFTDLGCGVQGAYYTQDFGGGAGQPAQPVAMGLHLPERPTGQVTFLATFDSAAPRWFGVETSGACHELDRFVGSDAQGGWRVEASVESGCVAYRFRWETQDRAVGVMPSTGAYQYGASCAPWTADEPTGCEDDPPVDDTGLLDSGVPCAPDDRNCDGVPDTPRDEDEPEGCACSGAAAPAGAWMGLVGLLMTAGIRRRASQAPRSA
jgi:MYXO-CTERM domain-containing protein